MKEHKDILGKGFVKLVDYMGNDQRVLDAARVSTGSSSKGEYKDRKLIEYLMKNEHETPFEKIVFEFHIRVPLYIGEQILRHRISSFNKESGRYKELKTDYYVPELFRGQNKQNKQASSGVIHEQELAKLLYEGALDFSISTYQKLLEFGTVRELSRGVLGSATFSEFYWTINFRSLMNFLSLRDDDHAQYEIQELAKGIKSILEGLDDIKWSLDIFYRLDELRKLFKKALNKDMDKLKDVLTEFNND